MHLIKSDELSSHTENGFRLLLISALAVVVGLIGGVAAWLLFMMIALFSNLVFFHTWSLVLPLDLQHNGLGAWIFIVPAIGGLIVGLLAKYGTPKICGHGIPEAMEAILLNRSKISPKVAIYKPIGTAVAIGTGAPFGSEGPVIQMGGAIGSMVGQLLHVTASERKVLLACGAAAGMAATFSTPIAAVIFSIELLLFEFKPRSFIPLVIAATLATTTRIVLMGPNPLFTVIPAHFDVQHALPLYAIFGIICGLAAVGFSKAFYWVEDMFEKLPCDKLWWPAIGGLGLGVIGYFHPRVLGVGYATITQTLDGQLALGVLFGILVFKTLALLVSLGSGTSGGLLAPLFTSGAAMGGIFAILLNQLFGLHLSPGAFALVGMAAVFAAASRATFAFIIFAFEITRNYESVLPLMLTCVIATGVAILLTRNSIMTERLARRGVKVNQDYEVDPLNRVTVAQVMFRMPVTLPADMSIAELAHRMASRDHSLGNHHVFPLIDKNSRLVGMISGGDVLSAVEEHPGENMTLREAGSREVVTIHSDALVHDAAMKMLRYGVSCLPVVDARDEGKMLGLLSRGGILQARADRMQEEHVREAGWLKLLA